MDESQQPLVPAAEADPFQAATVPFMAGPQGLQQPANPPPPQYPAMTQYPAYPPNPAYQQPPQNPASAHQYMAPVEVSKQQVVVVKEVTIQDSGPSGPIMLGAGPAQIKCPYCNQHAKTDTAKVIGGKSWCCFITCCVIGLVPCALVSCCMDGNKDTKHFCSVCHKEVGISRPNYC